MPLVHFISKAVIYWTLIVVSSKIVNTSALTANSSLVLALIHNQRKIYLTVISDIL